MLMQNVEYFFVFNGCCFLGLMYVLALVNDGQAVYSKFIFRMLAVLLVLNKQNL